jgi:hypothetical protein
LLEKGSGHIAQCFFWLENPPPFIKKMNVPSYDPAFMEAGQTITGAWTNRIHSGQPKVCSEFYYTGIAESSAGGILKLDQVHRHPIAPDLE